MVKKIQAGSYPLEFGSENSKRLEREKNRKEDNTTGWHYANDFNSTKFTDCCGSASRVGERCPSCDRRVI